MSLSTQTSQARTYPPIAVETMRTLLVCRGPIAFETLEIYRQRHWQLPHVVVSSREWIAELQRTAPWIIDLPTEHVHYVQEYDDVEAILRLAHEYGIDAIYPGYGFLAENADFAECVEQAGLRFIGPTPATLRAVGDKDAAITLAKKLGIPTIPGDDRLIALAQIHRQDEIAAEAVRRTLAMAEQYPGYPIRLKHPAGGGGKGQRVLAVDALQGPEAAEAIRDALTKVWSEMGVSPIEADPRKGVLLELNIPRPLHWEVQIFGDGATVVHFAARDCSLQNHGYQKFIEVALHPQAIAQEMHKLDPQTAAARITSLRQRQATLERICADALRLGTAVHLRGAATVEFLIDQQGQPYFLEVNPRIQVEHGVTEGIARVQGASISLVELQQRVAAGEELHFRQSDICFTGDAIEVRLNAWHEDLSPVLGGVVHAFRLIAPAALQRHVRLDASGLLQRRHPWIVPSYDANFALLIVTGRERHETLDRLIAVLESGLEIRGNTDLKTNLQPILGLLTLMRALPPETEFRTDTSLLWMALTVVVASQKQAVLALLPDFSRRPGEHDPARFARLLRTTLEAGFTHPSRLLTYYLKRLVQQQQALPPLPLGEGRGEGPQRLVKAPHPNPLPGGEGIEGADPPRPVAALEVLWQLTTELAVPLYEEERVQGAALQQAIDALWGQLSAAGQDLTALMRAAATPALDTSPELQAVCTHLVATTPGLDNAAATALLRYLLDWLRVDVPAIRRLIKALERTQIHAFLAANDDLSLTRPAYLADAVMVTHLQSVLSRSLRPTLLRHGELLSPMEATIYHQPEPGAPPFVEVGAEVKVGQTLALLEAMKMFTELPSPVDGILVEILVDSGHGVKTGTPLFRIATQETLSTTADEALHQAVESAFVNRFGLFLLENE